MAEDRAPNTIDYIELPANSAAEFAEAKRFYTDVFGWTYENWGDDYADTKSSGVGSGISADTDHRARYPLPVIYSPDLQASLAKVIAASGTIVREIFAFPGGRRFHFRDPAGNELAVWSDK